MRTTLDYDTCAELSFNSTSAWLAVLRDVECGALSPDATGCWINENVTLLHFAAKYSTAAVMAQLLRLHAQPSLVTDDESCPMHFVVHTFWNTDGGDLVEKAKLLPAKDLDARDILQDTPLHTLLTLMVVVHAEQRARLMPLLTWMLAQPECDLEALAGGTFTPLQLIDNAPAMQHVSVMITDAIAARRRWTAARAAWITAVQIYTC